MSRLIIAVDCDDVLISSTELLITEYNRQYGTSIPLEQAHDHGLEKWAATDKQEVIDRLTKIQEAYSAKPLQGAVSILSHLGKDHELHVITARPIELELVTLKLVEEQFKGIFASIEHVGHEGSKGEVCARLQADVLIDDSLRHLEDVTNYGVKGIWFGDYPWQQQEVPTSIIRCKNWAEVGEYFEREQF